jgi:hypothetical protein
MAEVRQVLPPMDAEVEEHWIRVPDGRTTARGATDRDLQGVEALRLADHPWQVVVSMAEFVQAEPLASRLHDAVVQAAEGVPGVTSVVREDTEVWLVMGDPAGDLLVRAVAAAVDELVPQARLQRARPSPADRPVPADRRAILLSAILAVLGAGMTFAGLTGGDRALLVQGVFLVIFFGGGGLLLLRRHRRDRLR